MGKRKTATGWSARKATSSLAAKKFIGSRAKDARITSVVDTFAANPERIASSIVKQLRAAPNRKLKQFVVLKGPERAAFDMQIVDIANDKVYVFETKPSGWGSRARSKSWAKIEALDTIKAQEPAVQLDIKKAKLKAISRDERMAEARRIASQGLSAGKVRAQSK